ncbi:glycosyltransferase [Planctomicrobium sp. SH527]|uniref:glycosyltransferase n=1 Tax=Planctomicrobium sp. SH527 TaxID=3448123 RepID=UPI003F5C08B9
MRVSVIIAVHNERDNLMRTLESLFETTQGLEMEVIVVDDGSKDHPLPAATRKYPRLKTLSFPERRGPGPAKDYGARESRGDTLVFLDSHTKPERGAVRRLVERVEELDGQAVLVPRVPALDVARWENSRSQVGYGYTLDLKTFASKWVALEDLKPSRQFGPQLYESPALIGCAFALSRRLYDKVWGQDPGMRGWGVEDLDLGLKCWLAGAPVLLDPIVAIGHRFQSEFSTYQVFLPQVLANQLRMARKNLTESIWIAWTEMARERFSQSSPKVPEGVWARGWVLFEQERASVEEERAYLLGHRQWDEFWFAQYFGLDWPLLVSGQLAAAPPQSRVTPPLRNTGLGHEGHQKPLIPARFSQEFLIDPSPSPSPPPPSSSSSSSGGGGVSSTSSSSSSSSTSGGGDGSSSSSSSCSTSTGPEQSSSSSCSSTSGGGSTSSTSSSGGGGGSSSSSSRAAGCESNSENQSCNDAQGAGGQQNCNCDGNKATSNNPVNYVNGNIVLSATDISSSGFGAAWSHRRTYSNQLVLSNAEMGQGTNWVVSNWPFLIERSDGSIALVRGTTASLWFDLVSGSYVGRHGSLSTLVHDAINQQFVLTSPGGTQQVFHDFDQTTSPGGEFAQQIEPGGFVTSVESYTDDGFIEEIHRTGTVGGQPLTEAFVYSYTENNQVETLILRRQLGTGGWEDVKRAVYSYWDGTNTYGNAGDLQQVTIQTPSSLGWSDSRSTVYRYYIPGQANGFPHGLKFVINPATYQRMIADSVNPLTAADVIVATYADNYYEFDGLRRVTLERTDGGAQTFTLAFTPATTSGGINDWAMKTVEGRPDGSQKTVYTNSLGQALIEELVSGSDSWIDAYHYDENSYPLWHAHPSAVLGYNDSSPDLDISLRSSAGLIDVTTYYSTTGSGAAAGYVSANKIKQGAAGAEVLLTAYEYTSHTAGGTTVYPVSKQIVYRNTDGTGGQVTTYDYTFYSGTTQIQQQTTTLPVVSTGQNGTGVAATRKEYYDELGRLTWSMDERGFISNTVYSLGTGGVVQQTQDVQTSTATGVPSGWTTPAGGGLNLVSDNLVDDQGRTIQSLGPTHQIDLNGTATTIRQASWTVYDDGNHVTYSGQGYFVPATSSFTLINPVSIQQMDDGGKILASISAVSAQTNGTLAEIIDDAGSGAAAFPQSSYVRLQTTQYTQCCLVASERVYFNIPSSGDGTEGTHYNQSNYGYDSMQRRNRTVTPGGTITDVVFDARSLVVSTYLGTNDEGATESDPTGGGVDPDNNMVLVTANVYDNGNDGDDGNLTQQTQYAAAADTRVTSMTYDFRSRPITTDGEIDYFQKNYYDNLDQQIKVERYDTTENGTLIARSETLFDDRGRQYRTIRHGVNPSTGAVGNALTGNTWYDAAGNSIQSLPAGSKLFTKTTYDSLGRSVVSSSGYTPTGETNNPASVDDDVILEQSETIYDAASNVVETIARQRYHTAPDTQLGALGDPSTAPKARVVYAANYPDALGRAQASATYGTNGGVALTRSSTIPTRSDTILVNSQTYSDAGDVFETTDSSGMITRMSYDDAGRQTSTVENYQSGGSSSSSSGSGCAQSDDTNRTTQYTYTADGQQATMTAVNSRTGNQTTTYTYGTTLANSGVASSLLLRSITYPDSTSGSDVVLYSYNRQRQRTTLTDQRGCVHTYDYDKLGRLVQDRVTTLGTGVDGAVRRLAMSYDVRGQVFQSTSYDNATVGTGSILNQVQKSYNDFQQLVTEYQSHGGAVNTSTTPKVEYTFANGSGNTIRPTAMVYPNDRTLAFDYGAADEINDSASRIAAIVDDDTTHLVEYEYLGQGSFVVAGNPQPDLQWTLASLTGTDDPDTGDIYAGLDRFGRIKDCRWYNTGTSSDAVRLKYGYDRASNRIWRQDDVARSLSKGFDELYAYDGLQRLKTMQRGLLNGSHDAISSPTYGQCWNLDATENWTGMKQAEGGASWTLEQARTANPVNEITSITNAVGPTWAEPAYDPAGNMTAIPQSADPETSFTATWDAWNRLVKLLDDDTAETIAEYLYDVTNRRILKKLYASGVLDQTRHIYLSSSNQVLEERVDAATAASMQNVWGLMYIDGLVLRDRDTDGNGILDERRYCLQDGNWNAVVLVDTSGDVTQRFCYQPFGTCEFLGATYSSGTNATEWVTLFTGRELDRESRLYYFRTRYLDSLVGVFTSRDKKGTPDGANSYASYFCPNDLDPAGTQCLAVPTIGESANGKGNCIKKSEHFGTWRLTRIIILSIETYASDRTGANVSGFVRDVNCVYERTVRSCYNCTPGCFPIPPKGLPVSRRDGIQYGLVPSRLTTNLIIGIGQEASLADILPDALAVILESMDINLELVRHYVFRNNDEYMTATRSCPTILEGRANFTTGANPNPNSYKCNCE